MAASLTNLGNVLTEMGQHEEAKILHLRAPEIWEESLGPEHPNMAIAVENLGNVLESQRKYKEAAKAYERAYQQSFGARNYPEVFLN